MEIERKFLADPSGLTLDEYPAIQMKQGYLFTDPVLRIRQENDAFVLTVKSGGLLKREEFELSLTAEQFEEMSGSVKGCFIEKTRYLIPCSPYTIELDIFHGDLKGLIYAEVEFPTEDEALSFQPPSWFKKEVTDDGSFTNAALSRLSAENIPVFMQRIKNI